MVHTCAQMSTEKLEGQIKTRVPAEVKRELEDIAQNRHLDLSDIVREAFREYLEKHKAGTSQTEETQIQPTPEVVA